MITVLMSVYNETLEWISQSIDSILNQSYKDFEYVIIVDNPSLSPEIIDYLNSVSEKDARIQIVKNEKNMGLAQSLNRGLSIAKGEYVARMDADDISFPDRLNKELEYLLKGNYDLVSAYKIDIDENGNALGKDQIKDRNPALTLKYSNYIVHPLVLAKTSVLKELGGYRLLLNSEDYDLWLRLLDNGYKIGILNEYLLYYRLRSNSASIERQLEQYYTTKYILKLSKERRKKGFDSFSLENQSQYLDSKDFSKYNKYRFRIASNYYKKAFESLSNNKCRVLYYLAAALLFKPFFIIEKLSNFVIVQVITLFDSMK